MPTPITYIEPLPPLPPPQPPSSVEVIELKDPEETYAGEGCNCYTFVKNRVKNLPRMAAILPISEPVVGGVAIEFFKEIKHVSVITEVHTNGVQVIESNYNHCKTGTRFIPYDKYSLVGFWSQNVSK